MIIGIDIRVLGNPVKSGVEEYTENLLARMLPLDSKIKFKLFYSAYKKKLPNFDWLHLPNVELFNFKFPNQFLFASTRFLNKPKTDQLIGGADVFFSPHFFLTSLAKCKRVTTFHDLAFIHFPEFFNWRQNFWHHFEMMPKWQSRFSDKIIAVSESTKNDLVEKYNLDPNKIEVVYSGISPLIKRPREAELENFKKEKKLPERFLLFLAKLEPRKNVVGIIKAFNLLKSNGNFKDLHLIIAGAKGWLCRELFREYSLSPFREQIIFTGQANDRERIFYYSLASVFVYPSFFEGFGFPPLEAMACGTPVVASNRSSLPEVVADCGLLANPYSIDEIANAIRNLLENESLRDKMAKRGLKRAGNFSWQKSAEKTLEVLVKA